MVLFSVASPSTTACIACKGTVAILSCCCCGLQMKRICVADAGPLLVTCQSCLTACGPCKFWCTLSFIPSEVPAACCVGRESVCKTNRSVAASSTSCGVKILGGSKRGSTPTGPPGGGMILGRLSGAGQLQTHCFQRHTLFLGNTDALRGCTQARCNLIFAH